MYRPEKKLVEEVKFQTRGSADRGSGGRIGDFASSEEEKVKRAERTGVKLEKFCSGGAPPEWCLKTQWVTRTSPGNVLWWSSSDAPVVAKMTSDDLDSGHAVVR